MSNRWIITELAFDVFVLVVILAMSSPDRVEAVFPFGIEILFVGAEVPVPDTVRTGVLLILFLIFSILLFSSLLPIILGLSLKSKEQIQKLFS